MEGLRR
jgi:rhodanese-related sulfurtransferase